MEWKEGSLKFANNNWIRDCSFASFTFAPKAKRPTGQSRAPRSRILVWKWEWNGMSGQNLEQKRHSVLKNRENYSAWCVRVRGDEGRRSFFHPNNRRRRRPMHCIEKRNLLVKSRGKNPLLLMLRRMNLFSDGKKLVTGEKFFFISFFSFQMERWL